MNPKRYYLFHDFETGGYNGTSVLSYYAQVTDDKFNKMSELELYFRPDDGIYKVETQALKYNKIDLLAHDEKAIPYSECKGAIEYFLWLWTESAPQMDKLYVGGHNVHWDNAILESIVGREVFRKRFHRHLLDTGTLGLVLHFKGKVPPDFHVSLPALAKHFGIEPKVSHEAKADVETTIAVLQCILKEL